MAERVCEQVRCYLFSSSPYGPKLRGQHLAMGEAILAVGRELGMTTTALTRLMERLRARAA